MRTFSFLSMGLIVACALIGSTYLATETFKTIKMKNGTIVVKGYAQKKLFSDQACWQGRLSVREPELIQAYNQLEKGRERLLAFLEASGIEKNLVSCSPVQIDVFYKRTPEGHSTNEVEGYDLNQTYCLNSSDVQQVAFLSKETSSLIKEGFHIHSYAPQYFYSRLDELKIAMLGEAAKDGRSRAEQLTQHGGGKVGDMLSAHQGVFQITPVHSTSVSDYGENDTSSIEKVIKAIVTMEYSLK